MDKLEQNQTVLIDGIPYLLKMMRDQQDKARGPPSPPGNDDTTLGLVHEGEEGAVGEKKILHRK